MIKTIQGSSVKTAVALSHAFALYKFKAEKLLKTPIVSLTRQQHANSPLEMQRDMMWGEAAFLASGAARGRAAVIDRPQAAAHKLRSRRRSIQRAASTTGLGLRHRLLLATTFRNQLLFEFENQLRSQI
ncbi:unnamed protein product [Arctia plantaginis]|uniref:Uncharacterized protein n=1 Tax=Arctia plantaginis TaxID=874455 RepID=A0A8S1A8R8_ARCPL|nr:unnamed protein product [Arctia plantaginis]